MHGALWVRSGQISVAPPAAGKEVPISAHTPFFIENKGKQRKRGPNKCTPPRAQKMVPISAHPVHLFGGG